MIFAIYFLVFAQRKDIASKNSGRFPRGFNFVGLLENSQYLDYWYDKKTIRLYQLGIISSGSW